MCCSDLHLLGPLSRLERQLFGVFGQGVVTRTDGSAVLAVREDHRCAFFDTDGCGLHKRLGRTGKPRACWRFPYGLVATPSGGRVTTAHYCSCRTLGAQPLDVAEAEQSLGDISGRLMADGRIEGEIALRIDEGASFASYEAREAVWIERLLSGEDPRQVVRELGSCWLAVADLIELGEVLVHTQWRSHGGALLGWFGYGLLLHAGDVEEGMPERPWHESFERARLRTAVRPAAEIFGDWVADVLWDLEWSQYLPLDRTLGELAVLLDVGHAIAARLEAAGARSDCAAGEAVSVIDMTRRSDPWRQSIAKLAAELPGG